MTAESQSDAHILPDLQPVSDHHGRRWINVWLYDTTKERMPDAALLAQRYACAGFLGTYRNRKKAIEAASAYPLFQVPKAAT